MSKTVWKHQIDLATPTASSPFSLPKGATAVHAAYERVSSIKEFVSIWFEVDRDAELEERVFALYGTGMDVPESAAYVATTPIFVGLVLHVYELATIAVEVPVEVTVPVDEKGKVA
jgi:hypothetical protein